MQAGPDRSHGYLQHCGDVLILQALNEEGGRHAAVLFRQRVDGAGPRLLVEPVHQRPGRVGRLTVEAGGGGLAEEIELGGVLELDRGARALLLAVLAVERVGENAEEPRLEVGPALEGLDPAARAGSPPVSAWPTAPFSR